MISDEEILKRARVFDAGRMPVCNGKLLDELVSDDDGKSGWRRASIEWRGNGRWAIVDGSQVLSKGGEWVYESLPSNRTGAFIRKTRFDSVAEAWEFWERWCKCVRERFAAGHAWGTSSWTESDRRKMQRAVKP